MLQVSPPGYKPERTARLTKPAGCITIPPQYLKKYTTKFEHGFVSLIKTIRSGTPPDNDRVSDHIAMLAFPQEKVSHYTTG